MRPLNPVRMVRRALDRNRNDVLSPFGGRGLQYGQSDPNSFPVEVNYDESVIFNGAPIELPPASAAITKAAGPRKGFQQDDHFIVNPLDPVASQTRQALNANTKRIALTLQNQSTGAANLYFTLNAQVISGGQFVGIKLAPGQGYTFDNRCVPSDPVYYAWDAVGGIGVVMEGTREAWPEQRGGMGALGYSFAAGSGGA